MKILKDNSILNNRDRWTVVDQVISQNRWLTTIQTSVNRRAVWWVPSKKETIEMGKLIWYKTLKFKWVLPLWPKQMQAVLQESRMRRIQTAVLMFQTKWTSEAILKVWTSKIHMTLPLDQKSNLHKWEADDPNNHHQ